MVVYPATLKISDEEHHARCVALLRNLKTKGLSNVVLFDSDYIKYYTGFAFIPTERPIAFVMNTEGERGLFAPRLELEHAKANAAVDHVEFYLEYPDKPHPMAKLAAMLEEMGISGQVAADHDGYPWIFGYRGPNLSEIADLTTHSVRAFVERSDGD